MEEKNRYSTHTNKHSHAGELKEQAPNALKFIPRTKSSFHILVTRARWVSRENESNGNEHQEETYLVFYPVVLRVGLQVQSTWESGRRTGNQPPLTPLILLCGWSTFDAYPLTRPLATSPTPPFDKIWTEKSFPIENTILPFLLHVSVCVCGSYNLHATRNIEVCWATIGSAMYVYSVEWCGTISLHLPIRMSRTTKDCFRVEFMAVYF